MGESGEDGGYFSVLLVDDEDDIRLIWRLLLQNDGRFDPIVEALDAGHAVSHLRDTGCFDVILTNFSMPDASGFDVIEESRERCPDAVIVMASASDVARAEALRRGATAFLTKEESTRRLMPLLAHSLAGKEQRA